MKRQNIMFSTLVLSASALFVRLIGFVFRVYLSNTMGAQGMGLYSLVMSVYALSITFATSGISTAVSKLAAEELARGKTGNARRILSGSVAMSLTLSCVVALILYLFADPIAVNILGDARTVLSLKLLAPGLPFLSVCACLRGYFIACRRVAVPASAQVIEQLFKMAFIMTTLSAGLSKGIAEGCALVVLGITLGEGVCLVYTLAGYLIDRRKHPEQQQDFTRGYNLRILRFALPISVSHYIRSILRLWEDILIVSGLAAFGGNHDDATGTYGMLRGMVMPLLIFPLSLLSAFVITLTPEVSRLYALSQRRRLESVIGKILQVTSILGVLIVCLLMSFSYEIGVVVYKDPRVGEMLRSMAFLCPFMCIETVVVSILQGMGEQTHSAVYSVGDCLLRVLMVWLLIPRWGVWGFVWMVVASNLFTSLLNLGRLMKITRISLRINDWVFKPVLAALAASQTWKALCNYSLLGEMALWQSLALGLMVISLVYGLVLLSVGSITRKDIVWILQRFRPGPEQMHAVSQKGG